MFRRTLFAVVLVAFSLLLPRAVRSDDIDELARKLALPREGIEVARRRLLEQPQVTLDHKGKIHVIYGQKDAVYYATSADGGASCVPPQEAFECRNMSLGMRRGPRLAVSGETVIVTAIGGEKGKGADGDLQAWRREADGRWSRPTQVNEVVGSAREGLHGMASGPDGTVWCAWLDLREKGTAVFAARSLDAGRTWGKNVLVYRSPEKSVCECCHPSVAVGLEGRVSILFRNSLRGNRDMFVATSTDGETFAAAVPLSKKMWRLAACPMDGGMLALAPAGSEGWAIYRREKQIFVAPLAEHSGPGFSERLLGSGDQPTITALATGLFLVWTSSDDLMVQGPGNELPRRLTVGARFPSVASDPSGRMAAVVWEQNEDKSGTGIRLKVFPAALR